MKRLRSPRRSTGAQREAEPPRPGHDERPSPDPQQHVATQSRNPQSPPAEQGLAIAQFSVLFARLFWFLVGPIALILTLGGILASGSAALAGLDVVLLATVTLMVYCRWFEFQSGAATTTDGHPATWEHVRRYAVVLPSSAFSMWLIVRLIVLLQ
jgi:hypothetical protein